MTKTGYREVVKELEGRGIMPDRAPSLAPMKLGLERIAFYKSPFYQALMKDPSRVIVIAGTNGKGSVSATLEALLLSTGERVGLYTSPHLVETTERIRIDGLDVSQDLFCRAYFAIEELTRDLRLTHFEMLTLMAVHLYCSGKEMPAMDRVILEVGLGGTWDATNAVPHGFCVITALGMDHENLLGSTLVEIAANKFGIIQSGARVVHSPLPTETLGLAQRVKAQTRSHWREAAPYKLEVKLNGGIPEFRVQSPWGSYLSPLPGARGAQNTITALTAFSELGCDPSAHLHALKDVRWPGRMERLELAQARCPIYLSGDHNPQGIASLIDLLKYYPRNHLHLLVGIGKDKDLDGICKQLFELDETSIYFTETPFKGRAIQSYGHWLEKARGGWAKPQDAFEAVLASAGSGDLIIVSGSLYLVGEIKRIYGA